MITSLQTRLLLTVSLLAATAVVIVALAARHGTRQAFIRFQDVEHRALSERARDVARSMARELDTVCCRQVPAAAVSARLGAELALFVVEVPRGNLVLSSGAAVAALDAVETHVEGRTLDVSATRRLGATARRVALRFVLDGVPLRLADGRPALLFVVPLPDERRAAAFLGSLDRRLVLVAGLVGLAAVGATWVLARSTVGPLRELRTATADVARGRLGRRVDENGASEIRELGRAFNAMAADLERQQQLRRDLVHDVAHELRTPLTALRCRLESVLDGLAPDPSAAVRDLHEETLQLGRLVDDLQDLALAEARELRLDPHDLRLVDVVESALKTAGLDADRRVRLDLGPMATVRADPVRLRQVVVNLLTNAGRHTPPEGTITVRAAGEEAGAAEPSPTGLGVRTPTPIHPQAACEHAAWTTCSVHNTGSRLDPNQVERLFDRFYRADPSRARGTGGTGLGLAIVRQLIEAHGGRVFARSGPDGVTVGFSLPRGQLQFSSHEPCQPEMSPDPASSARR